MKPQVHSNTVSFSVSEEHTEFAVMMADEIQRMVAQQRDDLAYSLYTGEPLEPRREVSRFRRWLGWVVHGWASWINPDVTSY